MLNNPLSHVDPSGEFLHIIIGAVAGGIINLTVKAIQGKIGSFKDGAAAFGIGAVAGGLGAATGGASLAASGLAGASVAGGVLAGAAGTAIASPIQGLGNMAYFGDKYSFKQWGRDILLGGVTGGVIGGATAYFKGNNIWLGDPIANGRNAFSFNNAPKYTASNTSYSINGQNLERNINPKTISETLDNFGIKAQSNNPIYKNAVDDYLNQMNNNSFDLKSGAAGYLRNGQALISDGHHKIIAATIKGMQTGNYGILDKILNNGNFRAWGSGYGQVFTKFRIQWQ